MASHWLSRRSALGMGAIALSGLGAEACGLRPGRASDSGGSASDHLVDIASDAYIFGYPLVLMDVTRGTGAPTNQFDHAIALPTPADRRIVRMNTDTLYSQAWLDVRVEPAILQVPVMDRKRYWLMQVLDAWSNTVHNPSSVRPKRSPAADHTFTYAITGPGWSGKLPDNVMALPVPTPTVWLLGRIQVNGPNDVSKVRGYQHRLQLMSLSEWLAKPRPTPVAPVQSDLAAQAPPPKRVGQMSGPAFFNRLCALMAVNPPAHADAPTLRKFATAGIVPGGRVDTVPADLLETAARRANTRIPDYTDPKIQLRNGWLFATDIGTYGTDYLRRANVALRGLGANLPQDAVYPTIAATADENGVPRRFRLSFAARALPPVDAFWSITAYDADGYLVPNSANIYTLGHQAPLVPNGDGSLDIAVQHADPGRGAQSRNWLPIPERGAFSLTMRLYAPRPVVLSGRWELPRLTPVA